MMSIDDGAITKATMETPDGDRTEAIQQGRKRQRREAVTDEDVQQKNTLSSVGNDCYPQVVQECASNALNLHHSWLLDPKEDDVLSADSHTLLKEELNSLNQQLTQVKRRLGDAKAECASAMAKRGKKTSLEQEFCTSRNHTNPMEVLGQSKHGGLNRNLFLNRSAVKLANLDAMLEFSLTKANSNETFLFADLCGAPGGFSEYLMRRCQQHQRSCRGYGMSLMGDNEHGTGLTWRLEDHHSAKGSCTINFIVSMGADGTGDIYNWDNVVQFQQQIKDDVAQASLQARKMDLVVADGGFDAQRESECQEELSQKLILCEFAAGLELLRPGGTMIVKLFGCQTESIRTAMRFMYDHFEWIQEFKPISSRPASQERYAVFSGFVGLPETWNGGPQWISSVLTGRCLAPGRNDLDYLEFDLYLDQIDRDMMSLNLKACFAILSDLERKTEDAKQGRSLKTKSNNNHHAPCVKMYRRAWKLNGLHGLK